MSSFWDIGFPLYIDRRQRLLSNFYIASNDTLKCFMLLTSLFSFLVISLLTVFNITVIWGEGVVIFWFSSFSHRLWRCQNNYFFSKGLLKIFRSQLPLTTMVPCTKVVCRILLLIRILVIPLYKFSIPPIYNTNISWVRRNSYLCIYNYIPYRLVLGITNNREVKKRIIFCSNMLRNKSPRLGCYGKDKLRVELH